MFFVPLMETLYCPASIYLTTLVQALKWIIDVDLEQACVCMAFLGSLAASPVIHEVVTYLLDPHFNTGCSKLLTVGFLGNCIEAEVRHLGQKEYTFLNGKKISNGKIKRSVWSKMNSFARWTVLQQKTYLLYYEASSYPTYRSDWFTPVK